jgi:poly-gamma-glutamate capsule biosynthesis protein CapA/YwtB (metallophosphatase superfamily)
VVATTPTTATARSALPTSTTATTTTTTTPPPPTTTTIATTTTRAPVRWRLLAGGDVLMDRTEPAGLDPFAMLQPALADADIALVNVEMAVSDVGSPVPGKEFVFRAPSAAAERIAAAGIDVASLGNNHARDYGPDALLDTVARLRAAGVQPVGAGADLTEAWTPAVLTVGDLRVAVLGATEVEPSGFRAGADHPGVAVVKGDDDIDLLRTAVAEAAAAFDVVLFVVHWGIERDTCPSEDRQIRYAEAALEAGASAVIGSHPHVLQPLVFDAQAGTAVAYSLGNFVWHPRSGITGETGVLELVFEDARVVEARVHSHLLNGDGIPVPASEGDRVERINQIVGGDCARHDPPPSVPPPSAPPSD